MYEGGYESFKTEVLSNQHIVDEFTEYLQKDEGFEFDFDEEVIVEGVMGNIIDRDKLVVESVRYNVYKVYIDGVQESIFEYDLKKK